MKDAIYRNRTVLLFAGLMLLVYFPLFLHLDYLPIRLWDESILGMNAIEMSHNHHYLVTYFNGHPEMANTKPPLMIWCIVLFIKVMGFSELSLRLPAALAGLALCIFLFWAVRRYTGSAMFGFLVVCILITCRGYIRNHVTRTGEYDSMLVLFSTISSFYLFLAVDAIDKQKRSKYLLLFFVMLTLAVLTKGVACLMLMPGLFIYTLLRKKVLVFLNDRSFYAGLGVFIVFGFGYYFLRERFNPGYLKAIWENELGGRFANVNEGHAGPFFAYLNEIITWHFVNYYILFPVAILVGLGFSESRIRRLVWFAIVTGLSFLFFISVAQTKLAHYDAPLFPYLAIITASLLYALYTAVTAAWKLRWTFFTGSLAAFVIVLALLVKPYSDIIATVYFPKGDPWEEGFSNSCVFFQAVVRDKEKLLTDKLLYNTSRLDYGPPCVIHCYQECLKDRGKPINIIDTGQLHLNDTALLFDDWKLRQDLEKKFKLISVKRLDKYYLDCILFKEKD